MADNRNIGMRSRGVENIALGSARTVVVAALGAPVKETVEDGRTVLWYRSTAGTLADSIYLTEDHVIFISLSHYQTRPSLSTYTVLYGVPERSMWKSAGSLKEVIHVWPSVGRAVVSVGPDATAQVIREDRFSPMSMQEYLGSWGKNLAVNEQATIAGEIVLPPPSVFPSILVASGISVVVLIVLVLLARRKKRFTQTPPLPV